jgi:hypothetical protein
VVRREVQINHCDWVGSGSPEEEIQREGDEGEYHLNALVIFEWRRSPRRGKDPKWDMQHVDR